jgi:hypothetical protein
MKRSKFFEGHLRRSMRRKQRRPTTIGRVLGRGSALRRTGSACDSLNFPDPSILMILRWHIWAACHSLAARHVFCKNGGAAPHVKPLYAMCNSRLNHYPQAHRGGNASYNPPNDVSFSIVLLCDLPRSRYKGPNVLRNGIFGHEPLHSRDVTLEPESVQSFANTIPNRQVPVTAWIPKRQRNRNAYEKHTLA